MRIWLTAVSFVVGLSPIALAAQTMTAAEAEIQKVVDAFHAGLKKGDTGAVMQLFAPDVLLLEAGGIETRAQYEKDHLPADIEFEKVVSTVFKPYRVVVVGDAAWAINNSEYKGTFRDRAVDSVGVELMVLSKDTSGWRIRAIHWSARARTPAK
jgi:ketosteroid isomerase-like protein